MTKQIIKDSTLLTDLEIDNVIDAIEYYTKRLELTDMGVSKAYQYCWSRPMSKKILSDYRKEEFKLDLLQNKCASIQGLSFKINYPKREVELIDIIDNKDLTELMSCANRIKYTIKQVNLLK